MSQSEATKQFYLSYLAATSGKKKTKELLSRYIADEKLIGHALFFESIFPEYSLHVDELVAEGDRVFVRAHLTGQHTGEADVIPPTNRSVDTPFALGYRVENNKIVSFWAIANEMEFLEQLGLAREQVNVER